MRIVKKFLTAAGLCSRLDTEEKLSDAFKMPREKDQFAYILHIFSLTSLFFSAQDACQSKNHHAARLHIQESLRLG